MGGTPITDYDVVDAMRTYGGSFVQAIASAFFRADRDNQQIIKAAWPEIWAEYADMARLRAEREAARR